MTTTPQRICILGGGFGGLYTALKHSEKDRLASQSVGTVLVARQVRFVFFPLLYILLSAELKRR